MKALDLTVYPTFWLSGNLWTTAVRGATISDPIDVDYWSACKRLTDAELAAEYYAQDSQCRHEQWIETVRGDDDYEDWERAMQSRMYERLSMLHRFATLSHYDEDPS